MIDGPVDIASIVEGHGEVAALPVLLRRLATIQGILVEVPHPIRISRSKLVKEDELKRAVTLASKLIARPGGILILIDADDDCPAVLAPSMQRWASEASQGVPVSVVIAKSEFEAWFIAAGRSIAGRRSLVDPLPDVLDPEAIRDAKGWLSRQMTGSRRYSETLDQPALAGIFDLSAATTADSFDKFRRESGRLFTRRGVRWDGNPPDIMAG